MPNFDYIAQAELEDLRRAGLFRTPPTIVSRQGPKVIIGQREYLVFCSNNYLSLASDRRLIQAAVAATQEFGTGSAASRLISGSMLPHHQLEAELAAFKRTPAALLFPTGYMANVGLISAAVGVEDTVIIDRLCHASIIDGCRLSRARLQVYPHNDLESLERTLQRSSRFRRRLIITESVFSMDGDTAPLPEIVHLAQKYGAYTLVDEAHATGVLGEDGRGGCALQGVEGQVDLVMGTLSKAVGSLGGFLAAGQDTVEYFRQRARSFIYTTAPPPGVCAAALAGLRLIREEPQRRLQLWRNVEKLRAGLGALGFNLGASTTQIIPVIIGPEDEACRLSQKLFRQGILIPAIRPPTVPKGTARLRITPQAGHTPDDIERLLWEMRRL